MNEAIDQAIKRAKTIDVHAHVVLAESMHSAGVYGPEIGYNSDGAPWFRIGEYYLHGVKYQQSAFMDLDLRLAAMDKASIDFQILSPNPLTYFHFIEAREAITFCRKHNDALSNCVAHAPQRIAGVAALPMQDIHAACDELDRAVLQLSLIHI